MNVSIFDTYVKKNDGSIMHFDIIVPADTPENLVFTYGKIYLQRKGLGDLELSSNQCQFCHVEHIQDSMKNEIIASGFYILEMQGC